jgi:hypothetical protein
MITNEQINMLMGYCEKTVAQLRIIQRLDKKPKVKEGGHRDVEGKKKIIIELIKNSKNQESTVQLLSQQVSWEESTTDRYVRQMLKDKTLKVVRLEMQQFKKARIITVND